MKIFRPQLGGKTSLFILAGVLAVHLSLSTRPARGEIQVGKARDIETKAELWWARTLQDVNGDGRLDLIVNHNGGHGGWLGWYETGKNAKSWKRHIIARKGPDGGTFAGGDLEAADIDGDGDVDALGLVHPGEWDKGGAPTEIYWYENPGWEPHRIGRAPAFVKDINIADFNTDGRPDVVTITNDGHTLTVFRQDRPDSWARAHETRITHLHEGMDTGDIDGDGDPDIATNGYWLESPGGDLSGPWKVRSIDEKWHNQTKGWQANATKVFCRDINGDDRVEVFISHSESPGYPLSWYGTSNPRKGEWTEHKVADNLPMAHTLQVFDMDGDGDQDVLTGQNAGQIRKNPKLLVFLNKGDNRQWTRQTIDTRGTYNSLVGDVQGDGLPDIWRLTGHEAKTYELLPNETK